MFSAAAITVTPSIVRRETHTAQTAATIAALLHWTFREAAARGIDARFALDTESGEFWIGPEASWPLNSWRTGAIDNAQTLESPNSDHGLVTARVAAVGVASPLLILVGDENGRAAVTIADSGTWPRMEPRWTGNR